MRTKYCKDNDDYFKWFSKNRDKVEIIKLVTNSKGKNQIKVLYELRDK